MLDAGLPVAQHEQDAHPVLVAYLPVAQAGQDEYPVPEFVLLPAAQSLQSDCDVLPFRLLYLPAAQFLQPA